MLQTLTSFTENLPTPPTCKFSVIDLHLCASLNREEVIILKKFCDQQQTCQFGLPLQKVGCRFLWSNGTC